jgi:predicted nucleotidyltransferase
MLTQDQILKIKDFVKNKPVEVVYLFGSQATNTARPDSDYDFGVLYQKQLDNHQRFEINGFFARFAQK